MDLVVVIIPFSNFLLVFAVAVVAIILLLVMLLLLDPFIYAIIAFLSKEKISWKFPLL